MPVLAILSTKRTPFRQANRQLMETTFRDLGDQLVAGTIDIDAFLAGMQEELRAGVTAAYRFQKRAALNAFDVGTIDDLLMRQHGYLERFGDAARMADDLGFVANRAGLYVVAAVEADARGTLAGAAPDASLGWDAQDDGRECGTCSDLSGQVQTVAEWLAGGILPSVNTDCSLACRCSFSEAAA